MGAGGNALEYKGKSEISWKNVGINNTVDIKGGVWCHDVLKLA